MEPTIVEIPFVFWPKQGQALRMLSPEHPCEVLGYGGAKGGGKSFLARSWAFARRMKYVKSKGLLIRESFPELERTHILELKRELPDASYHYVERRHVFEFPNGSTLELGYVERPEDVEKLYWGAEYDDIAIDEAQNHVWRTIQLLRACLRTTRSDLRVKMLLTFNWGGRSHADLKKRFWRKWMSRKALPEDKNDTWENESHWEENENPADFAFLQARVYDNPSIMDNDPKYVDRLKALPKALREAYLEGEPELLEGQFFVEFGPYLREKPFEIEESDLRGNLFGSLDSGTTHPTTFGLYWLSGPAFKERFNYGRDWCLHRLFTYKGIGGTIDGHAREIYSRIEGFPWIKGIWPTGIAADPSMWTKSKFTTDNTPAAIDFYEAVFTDRQTRFVPANNDKQNGCQIMRMLYNAEREAPGYKYWDGYNADLEDDIVGVVFDKNNREIYAKMDGDDIADQERYGIMHGWRLISGEKDTKAVRQKIAEYNQKRMKLNWKAL